MTTDLSSPVGPEQISDHSINPYVGPRAFDTNEQRFFVGRDDEIKILESQVMARRASLLFAQSGAGKSSLIRAGLIPELTRQIEIGRGPRKRFDQKMHVLPVLSVGGAPERLQQPITNIFIFNALTRLLPNTALNDLANLTLTAALAPSLQTTTTNQYDAQLSTLFVFDQFEELFTHHPDRWPERGGFFRQVNDALATYPALHVLFTMREDYIAELTPYAPFLPDQLRWRFRLERLKREEAINAVILPAKQADREFPYAIAEKLVDDLRRTQMTQRKARVIGQAGESNEALPSDTRLDPQVTPFNPYTLGDYIEPVHLQIVCHQLWERLPPERRTILPEDVEEFGDVDQALIGFYNSALARTIQATEIGEQQLRAWFSDRLITSARTRGLVYFDEAAGLTADLPNAAVEILGNAYIIRPEIRSSGTWYELAHDRLVEPILTANQEWQRQQAPPEIAEFSVAPKVVSHGATIELVWDVKNADRIYLEPGNRGLPSAAGRIQLAPTQTTSYKLRAERSLTQSMTSSAHTVIVLERFPGWAAQLRDMLQHGRITPMLSRVIDHQYLGLDERRLPDSTTADPSGDDPLFLKQRYLAALKQQLVEQAQVRSLTLIPPTSAQEELAQAALTVSDVARQLGLADWNEQSAAMLRTLAALPTSVYITTSFHTVLEFFLEAAGRQPQTDLCRWHPRLDRIASVFDRRTELDEREYEPTIEQPVVYHLYGLDAYPDSLVLTEEDHLTFLMNLQEDRERIPVPVQYCAHRYFCLILGFDQQSWEFKGLLHSLLASNTQRRIGGMVQVEEQEPIQEAEIHVVQQTLARHKLITDWSGLPDFVRWLEYLAT
jgi:hypothetical protein